MWAVLLAVAALTAGLPLAVLGQGGGTGAFFIPGDPKAGMRAFFDKGCARCHAVLGEGGRNAPDLARAPAGHLSASELVGAMWNHAPAMWEKMRQERLALPNFSEKEMANLFAFLYSVRSLDEPGDPERGRELLSQHRCLMCHALAGEGGSAGPDLRKWASYRNPVSWVQAMWNHAPAMQATMNRRGVRWPQFHDSDVADLTAYIRARAPIPRTRVYLRPGNSQNGERLFREKGCIQCHAIRGEGGRRAIDLGNTALPRTLGQFAGLMWNHAPAMAASMQARLVARPQFSNDEMADLIAYLFAQRYFEGRANAARGERLFAEKGCAGCHAAGALGPDLRQRYAGVSPISVATALWNHGPLMFEKMQERQISWPRFHSGEIVDLMEFISRGRPAAAQSKGRP